MKQHLRQAVVSRASEHASKSGHETLVGHDAHRERGAARRARARLAGELLEASDDSSIVADGRVPAASPPGWRAFPAIANRSSSIPFRTRGSATLARSADQRHRPIGPWRDRVGREGGAIDALFDASPAHVLAEASADLRPCSAARAGSAACRAAQDVCANERGRGVARPQARGVAVWAERGHAQPAATERSQPADRGSRVGPCHQCVKQICVPRPRSCVRDCEALGGLLSATLPRRLTTTLRRSLT